MPSYIFIFLIVVSPWLIFFSFLFYYAVLYDRRFNFFIKNKTQITKYFSLLMLMLVLMIYIFLFRLLGNTRSLNIYELFERLVVYLDFLQLSDIILFAIFFIIIIVFWLLALGWFYVTIRRRILALYLYFSQFRLVNDFFCWLKDLSLGYNLYLVNRVQIFTNNHTIFALAWYLWPFSLRQIKKIIYRYILPYVLIFDVLTNNGIITKFFIILPWYYIYSLGKACYILYRKIHKPENVESSIMMYGYGTRYDTTLSRRNAYKSQQQSRETPHKKKS